jgi:ring-1,2-phenylacetyl-CoA epoxidase subunit PaaC
VTLSHSRRISSSGRERVQDALDRLFPYAPTLFEPTAHEEAIVELGLRARPLDEMRREWLNVTVPFLESLDLRVPVDEGETLVDVPEATGRDGDHTDHWRELHEEFTHTYRDLEYEEPPRLMEADEE